MARGYLQSWQRHHCQRFQASRIAGDIEAPIGRPGRTSATCNGYFEHTLPITRDTFNRTFDLFFNTPGPESGYSLSFA